VAESSIAPELRTPLLEQLEIIAVESRRCGEIMRNLLTFARQAPLHRTRNDLNDLVMRVDRLMRHQFEMQDIEVNLKLEPNLPPVECDAGQIQQIVLVLIMNATEAMPRGGCLKIATESILNESSVRLRVADSGPGIPEDVLPHIFEPFFTTKEHSQSTGLGLAVAKSILDQHGGGIQVRSKEGEGAEFIVTLPAGKIEPAVELASIAHAE
jgi:two-component system NtrC family sensor kinase